MIKLGAHNILIPNPRDFAAFVKELSRYRFSFFAGVNTLFNALLHTKGFDSLDFSGLRVSLGGGMAVQQAVAERWKAVTGNVLTQAWGLTETSPAACINRPGDDFNGSIGLPISSTIITIRDDDGNALPQGQSGEICVEGPQVMRCYWNRPDETEKVMLPGQVLRTGDIGYMDARGFVYIEDRKKDMILVSGFNVYPNEVEGVAVTHPGACSGHSGGAVRRKRGRRDHWPLFVAKKVPAFTEEALVEHCRKPLTGWVPKRVFRDEPPKTNVSRSAPRTQGPDRVGVRFTHDVQDGEPHGPPSCPKPDAYLRYLSGPSEAPPATWWAATSSALRPGEYPRRSSSPRGPCRPITIVTHLPSPVPVLEEVRDLVGQRRGQVRTTSRRNRTDAACRPAPR
jgi:acyl-CoA synthetase (AMP-forming)/AMP-acid ligase II